MMKQNFSDGRVEANALVANLLEKPTLAHPVLEVLAAVLKDEALLSRLPKGVLTEIKSLLPSVDRERWVRTELGKNFLGDEAWRAQGIDVGVPPPIPASITKKFLNSDCPCHPGKKIKDTALLFLVPMRVNWEPYSALKLDELCSSRKGSGDRLIYAGERWATAWKSRPWAAERQPMSEWVLILKSDPRPGQVPPDKHFRFKTIAEQRAVHDTHYGAFREVKAVELMTVAFLYDLTHKERLLPDYLRCREPSRAGGRVVVGSFNSPGLEVDAGIDDRLHATIGRALAWKL